MNEILSAWRRERPDLDPRPMAVVGRLTRVSALIDSVLQADYARWDLDRGSVDVLFTLTRSGPPYSLSPMELAESTMVSSAAVAQRLNRLVARDLVRRERDPADGRGRIVTLTAKGKRVVDDALPSHIDAEERLLRSLSPRQRDDLNALLDLLLDERPEPPSK